jgi:hypothetical protein
MGKPSFDKWPARPTPRKSKRKAVKKKPQPEPLSPVQQMASFDEHDYMLQTDGKLSKWLNDQFRLPSTPLKKFYAYYEEYVQKKKSLLEKHCFKCKEAVELRDAYICGSKKCNKIYHRLCVPDPVRDFCPCHYCYWCDTRFKDGIYCHTCPESTCSKCLNKSFGKRQMTLCCTCAYHCEDGSFDNVVKNCLYFTPVKN